MNIAVSTSVLANKLRLVEKIAPQKSILPIMGNVLLRAENGELFLSTTNAEVSITTSCSVQVNTPGVITVPVKKLLDIVSQIDSDTTNCLIERNQLRVAAGTFKLRLQTLPALDFPTLPTMPAGGLLLPSEFKQMVKRVRYAISDADKRYFTNGALLSLTENAIALVATDGKRLALTAVKRSTPGASFEIIIPTKTLDVLLSDEAHEDIMFNKDIRQMFFASDVNVLTSRMLEGQFPNYKRIMPQGNVHVMKIPRTSLLQAVRRVSIAANETKAITLTIEENALALSSADAAIGEAVEHLAVNYTGPAMKLHFNYSFIMDFLDASREATVQLKLKDEASATLWSDGEGSQLMNVIMTMKL